MINLNLLSPTQKETLRLHVLFSNIERFMVTFVAMTLLATGVLMYVKEGLIRTQQTILDRQILGAQYVSTNNETKRLNAAAARVELLHSKFFDAAALIGDVVSRARLGISVSMVEFNPTTKKMSLAGVADTREALLDFEAALRGSPHITKLTSPISNILQRKDINFTFSADLMIDDLYGIPADGEAPPPPPPTAPDEDEPLPPKT